MSEQMTVVEPRVSTAGKLRMMARRRAMRETPIARVTVSAAGRPSGMAPTARAIAAMRVSTIGWPRSTPMPKVSADKRQDGDQQHPAELGDLAGEGRFQLGGAGDQLRDAPNLAAVAGRDDHAGRGAIRDQGGGVSHIAALSQHSIVCNQQGGIFLHRQRLAGEGSFGHLKIARGHQAEISRDA